MSRILEQHHRRLATSIVELLAQQLCSDAHNYHYHHKNNKEDGPVKATGTETKGFADFLADLSNFTTSKEIVVGGSNNTHCWSHNVAEAQNKRGVRSTRGGLLATPQKASASKKLETKDGTLSTPNNTNITPNFQYTKKLTMLRILVMIRI